MNSFIVFSKKFFAFTICAVMLVSLLCSGMITSYAADGGSTEVPVPKIRVVTENGNGTSLQKEDDYVKAHITITDTDDSVLEDDAQFKVRGNTTAMTWVTKKAYTFKFAKKKDVLGMGKGKKWALIANAYDPTQMRNFLTFDLAQKLEIPYTSNQKYVELWVDDVYRGCYVLYEPVQEGKDRVDIDIESNDGKKDFLLEYERSREEEGVTYFTTDYLRFIVSEPEEPTEEQLQYVKDTVVDIIKAFKTGDKDTIAQKVDLSSFVKFYLLNEFVKPHDFDMSSVFFYYKDGKLYAGPPWDYDLSAGNSNADLSERCKNANDTQVTRCNQNFYKYIYDKQWFLDMAKEEYKKYHTDFCNMYQQGGMIDTILEQHGEMIQRNFDDTEWKATRWGINIQKQPLPTYERNVDYLKSWYSERHEWMIGHLGLMRIDYLKGDANNDGTVDVNDVTYVQKLLARIISDDDGMIERRSNVLGGSLSVNDATQLQRYLASYENRLNINTPVSEVQDIPAA